MIKIRKTLLTFVFILTIIGANSQTIFGKWYSKNEETGQISSVIEVYEKNGKAYAKVVAIKDPEKQEITCTECNGENKGKKVLGLHIITGLEKNKNEWSGGTILDPRNGKEYKCYIKLIKPNTLKIRGYIGFSLLGKTAYWQRAD